MARVGRGEARTYNCKLGSLRRPFGGWWLFGEVDGTRSVYAFCHLCSHHVGGVSGAHAAGESEGGEVGYEGMRSVRGDAAGVCEVLSEVWEGALRGEMMKCE